MITVSGEAAGILGGSYVLRCRAQSWLGATLLDDAVPVAAATEETDRTLRVPERVTLTVPRRYNGIDYTPKSGGPLAAEGQRLSVQLGIGLAGDAVEWMQRGWFLVQDARAQADSVQVAAVGLLALVDEARLVTPYQPSGTLISTLRALIEPALTVVVDSALTDRSVPTGIAMDEDRLQAVLDLLDAWPADASMAPDGYLSVVPAGLVPAPVLSLTDGVGGTVVRVDGGSTRQGGATVVVARGTAPDGGQVQGTVFDNSGGPHTRNGPFNPLQVPYFYQSPLLTTTAQCTMAAATVLDRLLRASGPRYTVTMVPHPALQAGDVVEVTSEELGLDEAWCSVEVLSLPYTADGGAETITVRLV